MSPTRIAVCRGPFKQVENVIVASLSDPAPANCQFIEVMNEQVCAIGMIWNNGGFKFPPGIGEE